MTGKKVFLLPACFALFVGLFSMQGTTTSRGNKTAVAAIASLYQQDMELFDATLAAYPQYFCDSSQAVRVARYNELLYRYKQVECLFAYFHPELVYQHFLKPPQHEARDSGLQLPDNWIWAGPFGLLPDSVLVKNPGFKVMDRAFIDRAVTNFRKLLRESNYMAPVRQMQDADVFDALRLQLYRMSTMGIANADFVVSEAGMPSFTGYFDSWTKMVGLFAAQLPPSEAGLRQEIGRLSAAGKQLLANTPDFDQMDKMQLLTTCLLPLSEAFNKLQAALQVGGNNRPAAVNTGAPHIYGGNVFNANFFAPDAAGFVTAEKVELGKLLFFDPILSDNNERACASCHKPELAFTDGTPKSLDFNRGDLPRNAPTVINSGFQKLQFWDLRATSLEDQLDSVVNSPDELHSSFENVVARINSSKAYQQLFHAAFPETKTSGIERRHVKTAIAVYERTLTGMNSRFDQYMQGDTTRMNRAEINGFNLFMGKAKCGTCHYAPLFNGALPPYFEITDQRSIGVPLKDTMDIFQLDPDTGASRLTRNPLLHFSFKIPTVRNAAVTAPYMHNGVYQTLEQVINFYDHAGGNKFAKDMQPGMKGLPFFMILGAELKLNEKEKQELIAFVRTLTDTTAAANVPHRLPKLTGKYASLNKRKIGGIY